MPHHPVVTVAPVALFDLVVIVTPVDLVDLVALFDPVVLVDLVALFDLIFPIHCIHQKQKAPTHF